MSTFAEQAQLHGLLDCLNDPSVSRSSASTQPTDEPIMEGRTMMYLSKKLLVAVAVLVTVAAASAAFAAIPSSNGTINACLDSKGALKVIDVENNVTCGAGKQLLTWNQRGPQGEQGLPGPQGAQGAQGAQGPAGPSDAYVAWHADLNMHDSFTQYPISSLDLGPGKYVVFARAALRGLGLTKQNTCRLVAGNNQDPSPSSMDYQTVETYVSGTSYIQDNEISLMTAHEFASPGTATLTCSTTGMDVQVKRPVITAIKVADLTTSGVLDP